MGNPYAKTALVEYGSLACPHCRHFEETGYKPLVQQYVRTGRVSYEFRNFLLNAPDICCEFARALRRGCQILSDVGGRLCDAAPVV